jgi:hypothetical protein
MWGEVCIFPLRRRQESVSTLCRRSFPGWRFLNLLLLLTEAVADLIRADLVVHRPLPGAEGDATGEGEGEEGGASLEEIEVSVEAEHDSEVNQEDTGAEENVGPFASGGGDPVRETAAEAHGEIEGDQADDGEDCVHFQSSFLVLQR